MTQLKAKHGLTASAEMRVISSHLRPRSGPSFTIQKAAAGEDAVIAQVVHQVHAAGCAKFSQEHVKPVMALKLSCGEELSHTQAGVGAPKFFPRRQARAAWGDTGQA